MVSPSLPVLNPMPRVEIKPRNIEKKIFLTTK
jgi:hypothetical protein